VCAKPESLNLEKQKLWTPTLVSERSFVHLKQTELECARGVNEAVWRIDRRRGQSAGQGHSHLSYIGVVGVIATTGQRMFVKKHKSAYNE